MLMVWKNAVEGTGTRLPPAIMGASAFQIAILLSCVMMVVGAEASAVVVNGCCWDV